MSISDCPSCWETPCICGEGYSHLSTKELISIVKELTTLIRKKNFLNHDTDKRYHKGCNKSLRIVDGVFRE